MNTVNDLESSECLLAFNKYLLSMYCVLPPEIGSPSPPTHGHYSTSTMTLETREGEGETNYMEATIYHALS